MQMADPMAKNYMTDKANKNIDVRDDVCFFRYSQLLKKSVRRMNFIILTSHGC
jgi:hypothetical protein